MTARRVIRMRPKGTSRTRPTKKNVLVVWKQGQTSKRVSSALLRCNTRSTFSLELKKKKLRH
jgi:hypothetical protein